MKKMIKTFFASESGATVVDMTMLMAALVSLTLAVSVHISNGVNAMSGDMDDTNIIQDSGAV